MVTEEDADIMREDEEECRPMNGPLDAIQRSELLSYALQGKAT